jgi:hypothetical protein
MEILVLVGIFISIWNALTHLERFAIEMASRRKKR